MDRKIARRNQIPYESDFGYAFLYPYEALGLLIKDLIGDGPAVAGFPALPTSPASLSITVGPGRIYVLDELEPTPWGQIDGQGGIPADTNPDHRVVKQGLMRDTQTFAITPPVAGGQSMVYLVQGQYQNADDPAEPTQFYNPSNPGAPITSDESQDRRDLAILALKAGTPATTGSQTAPAADAGWVPLWEITVANGDTTIEAGDIDLSDLAPLIDIGGGGPGPGTGLSPWQPVSTTYTAVDKDRLLMAQGAAVTLPAAPAVGTQVTARGDFATGTASIIATGKTIGSIAGTKQNSPLTLDQDNLQVDLVYVGGNHWQASR